MAARLMANVGEVLTPSVMLKLSILAAFTVGLDHLPGVFAESASAAAKLGSASGQAFGDHVSCRLIGGKVACALP
jgi:hypothetical protein